MKKTFNALFLLFILPALSFAQTSVSSKDIVAKINAGEAVSYKNARIEGDLDLTQLQNKRTDKNNSEGNYSKTYVSTVTAPVVFANCTFTGKVLAYYNPDNNKVVLKSKNEVYNTDFASDVTFSNCTFQQDAAFKYSNFKGSVSFAGSRFNEEALFKYAVFSSAPDFNSTAFNGDAIFKYVKFPANTGFMAASFKRDADFKYAEFKSGANFGKAVFSGLANFKYSKFSNPEFAGADFKGSEDFKYTSVNGRKTGSAALTGR